MATKEGRLRWRGQADHRLFREADEEGLGVYSRHERALKLPEHSLGEGWHLVTTTASRVSFPGYAIDMLEGLRSQKREHSLPTSRYTDSVVIAGEPGRRHLLSLTVDEVQTAATRVLKDESTVRSLWAIRKNNSVQLYVVVDSWEFEDLESVYESERELHEHFPDVELGFEFLLEGEEDWIPDKANLLLRRS